MLCEQVSTKFWTGSLLILGLVNKLNAMNLK